jgi:hypothetical protein
MKDRRARREAIMQLIQDDPHNTDIRRAHTDHELAQLIDNILSVGVVALSEEDAVEAYQAGAKAVDRVLLRIARDADQVAREARRARR